jgi:hypothetical protein
MFLGPALACSLGEMYFLLLAVMWCYLCRLLRTR